MNLEIASVVVLPTGKSTQSLDGKTTVSCGNESTILSSNVSMRPARGFEGNKSR
jgi:hypothetical protein